MDARDLASLLIRCYLSPAAETWDTSVPAKRWDPIKMAVGVTVGWAITRTMVRTSPLGVASFADALVYHLQGWAGEDPTRSLILDGGATGKGGFRGRLAAELVNLGY